MKKLLILSGKGGTGKTTVASAFIEFSKTRAFADCDVDAPNLHLLCGYDEGGGAKTPFYGMDKAEIDKALCTACGKCHSLCRFGAVKKAPEGYEIDPLFCEGCGLCVELCPAGAVKFVKDRAGTLELYKDKRVFSTAKLRMGRGNSGKLVSEVKKELDKNAPKNEPLAVIDGSPGIGCPVIASTGGVTMVLIIIEPSLSGMGDAERVMATAKSLGVPAAAAVNKWDISPENTEKIKELCEKKDVAFLGKIPYDKRAFEAVNRGLGLADFAGPAKDALFELYENTLAYLSKITSTE